MKARSLLNLCLTIAAILILSTPALALGPGGELEERCGQICGSASCDSDCFWNGAWTKCAIYNGNPANDYDSDGISNTSDNCDCSFNPGQADCDGDGRGDPCDGNNEKWVRILDDNSICHTDADNHVLLFTIEFFSKEVWQEVCGGATCVKKIEEANNTCTFNISHDDCCLALRESTGIPAFCPETSDNCGSPSCPF